MSSLSLLFYWGSGSSISLQFSCLEHFKIAICQSGSAVRAWNPSTQDSESITCATSMYITIRKWAMVWRQVGERGCYMRGGGERKRKEEWCNYILIKNIGRCRRTTINLRPPSSIYFQISQSYIMRLFLKTKQTNMAVNSQKFVAYGIDMELMFV